MSPAAKYTLGRLGLFVVVFVALLPVTQLHILIRAMIALLVSAVAAFFLLQKWRDEAAQQIAGLAARRRAEKDRLRAALAGDEAAAAEGDRAAADTGPPAAEAGPETRPAGADGAPAPAGPGPASSDAGPGEPGSDPGRAGSQKA